VTDRNGEVSVIGIWTKPLYGGRYRVFVVNPSSLILQIYGPFTAVPFPFS
jgi:hypothetical protein